jgi:nitroreductase / dihydropteridine reductase
MNLIELLNRRYACKKYDPAKKLSEASIQQIMEAIRLAPSSFGLQAYKVLVIEDLEMKTKLKPISWNQSIIEEASHVFIFCNYTELSDETLNKYAALRADKQGKTLDEIMPYIQYIRNSVGKYGAEQFNAWASKQTYIALGHALIAAAELGIDATPVEGFDKPEYDKLLNLKEQGLASSVVAVFGHRTPDEYNQFNKKVRKSKEDLFKFI